MLLGLQATADDDVMAAGDKNITIGTRKRVKSFALPPETKFPDI